MPNIYRINHMYTAHTICRMMLVRDRFKQEELYKILPGNKASRQQYWKGKQISALELKQFERYSALVFLTKKNASTSSNVWKTITRNTMKKLRHIQKHLFMIGLVMLLTLSAIWLMHVFNLVVVRVP